MRDRICKILFELTKKSYAYLLKRQRQWSIAKEELSSLPKGSLGKEIYNFLSIQGFNLIPKLEKHDAYHVITDYPTHVVGEIELQCFFVGNGKWSIYMFGCVLIGMILYPEQYKTFHRAYRRGERSNPLHALDIEQILHSPLAQVKDFIFHSRYSIQKTWG